MRPIKISNSPDKNWQNNDIQFPRLLTEIADTCLGPSDYVELAASMDLTVPEVHELFERAQQQWDDIKLRTGDKVRNAGQ